MWPLLRELRALRAFVVTNHRHQSMRDAGVDELELKAVMHDPEDLRARLVAAGAAERFSGRMSDRRFDRGGELTARDEVLRVRTYHHADGSTEAVLGWKGPTRRSAEGYKQREELELPLALNAASPAALLTALGYDVVHAIDREVDVFDLDGATLRLERYPRMDSLVEVEGNPAGIERAIRVTGIDRAAFTADSLTEFVRRFEARTGQPAVLASQ